MLMNCNCSSSSSNVMRDCDSCRSAPGAVYCRADAAVLCTACDADIHSANLISQRHHRVPVLAIPNETGYNDEDGNLTNYAALFGEEVDEYLVLGELNSCTEDQKQYVKSEGSEGVVPVQSEQQEKKEYEVSNAGFSFTASLSPRVSLPSMEASSIVPDTTVTDISNSHIRPSKGTIELFSAPFQMPTQFSPVDREARVLRYREKKKTRKFEKTIRYASRKAYAEVRPRIKGRFAKRSEVELEVDQMFSNYIVSEDGYGIVPSF